MPRRTPDTRVPIPIGGGVDDEADEFTLAVPAASVAENLARDKRGALKKLPGFDLKTTLANTESRTLVPGPDGLAILGDDPPLAFTEGEERTLDGFASLPTEAVLRPVASGRGFVHSVQLAHAAGYTCVAWSFCGDVTTYAPAGNNAILYDYQTAVVVTDSDDRVVWGPHTLDDIKWLPRVEVLQTSHTGGLPTFLVIGVNPTGLAPVGSLPEHVFLDPIELSYARIITATDSTPTEISLGAMHSAVEHASGRDGDNEHVVYKAYDTVADTTNDCAYVAWRGTVGTQSINTARITATGVTTSNTAGTSTSNDHVAIGLDVTTDTLLVYDRVDSLLRYQQASTLGTWASIAAPSLEGIDTAITSFVGVHTGDREYTPEFWRNAAGQLKLNERIVSFTGSDPGVPATAAHTSPNLPHVYGPTVLGGHDVFFYGGQGRVFWEETLDSDAVYPTYKHRFLAGASTIEVYHLDDTDGLPRMDAALFETRLGDHNHRVYTWLGPAVDPDSETENPCVTGQTATTADGRLLVPSAWLTSLQKVRNSWALATWDNDVPNSVVYAANVNSLGNLTDGAGYYNDEQVVGYNEVTFAGSGSSTSMNGGAIICAGQSSWWSDTTLIPAALRAPRISDYADSDTITATRKLGTGEVGMTTTVPAGLTYTASPRMAAVVVVTLADGTELRSPPSRIVLSTVSVLTIQPAAGSSGGPIYCPTVSLEMHPQVLGLLASGAAIDIEFYVTSRAVTTALDNSESTLTMVTRMPLQKDSVGYFIHDTLQDFHYRDTSGSLPHYQSWLSPPHSNALYTVANELPPDHLPSSQVMTQAGEYVFALSSEDSYELWVSKPLVRGRVPEFNAQLTLQLPPSSGGAKSLAAAFDRLFVMCASGVWELPVLGGPDATGNGTFPPFRRLYLGEECLGHAGTVETPAGAFYITSSGPRLLSSEGDSDVGRSVADRLDWTAVNSATYLPDRNRVVWGAPAGMVMLDLNDGVWTHSDLGCIALGRSGDNLLRVRTNGQVVVEDEAEHGDGANNVQINGTWTSPWLTAGDTLGYKRLTRVGVLLRIDDIDPANPGAQVWGNLFVEIAYDFDDTVVDSFSWAGSELQALAKRQLVVKPSRQKATAYKITVRDGPETVVVGQEVGDPESRLRWALAGLELKLRGKQGLGKLEAGGSL